MPRRILILLLAAGVVQSAQVAGDVGHQAAIDLRAGDYNGAKQILDAALKQSPHDARLWTLHGLTLVRLGSPSEALASFNRALEIAPTYSPALEGAAQIESQTGSPHAAATLERLLAIHPNDETALRELSFFLVKQKRAPEALSVFKRLADLQPSDEKVILDLASVQFLTAHYPDVIATLTPLAAKQPPNVEALDLLAQAYSFTSDTEKALAVLQTAIAANSGNLQSYIDFANICLAHGLFQTGIDSLNSAMVRMPYAAPLYVARGVLYSELGQYEQGEADFRRAEQLDANVEGGSFARGLSELQRNDLSQAEATVRNRLRLQPHDASLLYLLAEVLTRKGAATGTPEFQQALDAARESVTLKPDFALGRDLLGRLYLQAGDVEEAIRQSRLALHSNPTDQKALYHLIVAVRRSSHTQELPALLKQLVMLRQQSGNQEAAHNIEQSGAANLAASQP